MAAATESHTEQPAKGHQGKEVNPLLKPDPGVGIWALVTFSMLLFILGKYAWKPIMTSIAEREKKLQDSFNSAEAARDESRRISEEQKYILSQTRIEAAEIVAKAKTSAEELKKKLEESALEEKKKIIESATQEVQKIKENAIFELKTVTANLAIGAAEKILGENLDEKKSRMLVDKYIEEMDS
jgi:F-type H+-transporting ATPase subunit b